MSPYHVALQSRQRLLAGFVSLMVVLYLLRDHVPMWRELLTVGWGVLFVFSVAFLRALRAAWLDDTRSGERER